MTGRRKSFDAGREADPLDPVDGIDGPQQLTEVGLEPGPEIAAPRIDVLAEQRHLAHSVRRQPRHSATISPGRRLVSRPRTAGTMQYEHTELQPMETCTHA